METEIVKQENEIVNVQALISQGLEKNANIEVMERLFAMAKEADAIRAKRAFFDALAKFQKDTPKIIKVKPVKNKDGVIKYYYAPLDKIVEQIKDKLDEHGFSYTLKTKQENGTITVTCEAHHVAGHTELTDMTVPVGSDYMSPQQQVGAALSFAKRYAFCDAFGILTGDEDTDAVNDADAIKTVISSQPSIPEKEEEAPKKEAPNIAEWKKLWAGYKEKFSQIEINAMRDVLTGKPVDEQNQILKNALVAIKPEVGK